MAKSKHYVFSARTTEGGLRLLNSIKGERGFSWDEVVIDAVCAHYGLDRSALALARADKLPSVDTEVKSKPKAKIRLAAKAKVKKKEASPAAPEEPSDTAD